MLQRKSEVAINTYMFLKIKLNIIFPVTINCHGGRIKISDSFKIAFLYIGSFNLYMTPKLGIMIISLLL